MLTLKDILASARQRPLIAAKSHDAETIAELMERVDRPDTQADISESMYFDLCRYHQPIVARLPYAFFRLHHTDDAVRLFWIDRGSNVPKFFGTRLSGREQDAFVCLMGPKILESEGRFSMMPTGFGPFSIGWLRADEPFVDIVNRPGIATGRCTDHEWEVVLFPGGIRATCQSWPAHVCVFVPKFHIAHRIRRRQLQPVAVSSADTVETG